MKISDKMKQMGISRIRLMVQLIFTVMINSYIAGFQKGTIFTGKSKLLCVPVLNCYSCPGARFSCPIGSLQAVIGGYRRNFSFYIWGFIMLTGVILGRMVCGFLCPFGLVQDLLYKIPLPKLSIPNKPDRILRYLKYAVALFMVILLPALVTNVAGAGDPFFCKWICPVGTLQGGIPLTVMNENLREIRGFLFNWKMALLIIILGASILIYRPFCKFLCPLGAFYGLFNRFSLVTLQVDRMKCNGCRRCEQSCPMQVNLLKNPNSAECIRCGRCSLACDKSAIKIGIEKTKQKTDQKMNQTKKEVIK